jgi:hypothetical protein
LLREQGGSGKKAASGKQIRRLQNSYFVPPQITVKYHTENHEKSGSLLASISLAFRVSICYNIK